MRDLHRSTDRPRAAPVRPRLLPRVHRRRADEGESQTCPLCRADLPPGVEGLFDLATRAYRRVGGRVRRGEAVWESLEGESAEEMEEAVAMLVEAVAQGHVGAMGLLAEVYEGGHGVDRDEARAGELRRKVEEL